jgi:hypothetical protein
MWSLLSTAILKDLGFLRPAEDLMLASSRTWTSTMLGPGSSQCEDSLDQLESVDSLCGVVAQGDGTINLVVHCLKSFGFACRVCLVTC